MSKRWIKLENRRQMSEGKEQRGEFDIEVSFYTRDRSHYITVIGETLTDIVGYLSDYDFRVEYIEKEKDYIHIENETEYYDEDEGDYVEGETETVDLEFVHVGGGVWKITDHDTKKSILTSDKRLNTEVETTI